MANSHSLHCLFNYCFRYSLKLIKILNKQFPSYTGYHFKSKEFEREGVGGLAQKLGTKRYLGEICLFRPADVALLGAGGKQ